MAEVVVAEGAGCVMRRAATLTEGDDWLELCAIRGPDGRVLGLPGPARALACETSGVNIRDNRQLVAALLDVSGVSGASIEAAGSGPGTLRLQLAAGTDQAVVAGEVNRLLRSRFGLAVDPDRVRVIDETDKRAPGRPGSEAPGGRHAVAEPLTDVTAEVSRASSGKDEDDVAAEAEDARSSDETAEARPTGSSPAIGAYARDAAVGIATIFSTDQRIANGTTLQAAPEVTLARPSRLTIEHVQLVSAGLGTSVSVTLGLDGRMLEGEADGAATQSGLLRSVAVATVRAIEAITDGSLRFEVEHVEVARTGTDQTALVVITMLTGRSAQRLSGASVVREDTREAVIRAVLAALNRRMEPLIAET
jgi:hypothetical protein